MDSFSHHNLLWRLPLWTQMFDIIRSAQLQCIQQAFIPRISQVWMGDNHDFVFIGSNLHPCSTAAWKVRYSFSGEAVFWDNENKWPHQVQLDSAIQWWLSSSMVTHLVMKWVILWVTNPVDQNLSGQIAQWRQIVQFSCPWRPIIADPEKDLSCHGIPRSTVMRSSNAFKWT